jgi:hypothetical protein
MGNIHVLPTDKPSRIYLIKSNNKLGITSNNPEFTENFGSGTQNQHIYITSDEEIKEGDWCLDLMNNKIYVAKKVVVHNLKSLEYEEYLKKIILTTDLDLIKDGVQPIDDEFLEWFVNNPSCEEVEVYRPIEKGIPLLGYKIIIPKEEDKYPNNLQGSVIDLSAENNSFYLPEQKRVMFKFDDDEPEHINSIVEGGKFIIELQEGIISFEKDGKKFQIYIETT